MEVEVEMADVLTQRAPWFVAGPLLGLIVVGLLWTANKPLGALGGYIQLHDWLRRPSGAPGWRITFLAGVIGGGLLSAWITGGNRMTLAYGSFDSLVGASIPLKALVLAGAGALIGYGARTAGGCTSGHGLCGTSLGSKASLIATMTFMATGILVTQILSRILGGAS
jgi:uncharacterized membrane protein YedE/YeeE